MRHIQLAVDVGEADVIDLKITSGKMVGILHIEKKGLSFSSPKAKKEPKHSVAWEKLSRLITLSNGFAKLQQ